MMNERSDDTSTEEDNDIQCADLGDAMEETKQYHPLMVVLDSALVYGRAF